MLHTLETGSGICAAKALPPEITDSLSLTAKKLYLALLLAAEEVKENRGYHPKTSQVTFFCPVEAVALSIGVSRQTLYNHLPALAEMGLVEQTGHYCAYRGQTRSDGSLWAVKLDAKSRAKVKIDHDWLKKSYRNLGADIASGRTAWQLLQSKQREDKSVDISYILTFAIISTDSNSINNDCQKDVVIGLESLLDVPYVPVEARNEAVDKTARAVSSSLGSPTSSLMFYRWLLWQLLRLEQQGKSYSYQIFLMLQRAKVEKEESACRNAGGLFVSRLKQSPIWDDLRNAPSLRVGSRPKNE